MCQINKQTHEIESPSNSKKESKDSVKVVSSVGVSEPTHPPSKV